LLNVCFGGNEVVDETIESGVFTRGILINECFENEGRVADPCVEVVGVGGARAGDDNARLPEFRSSFVRKSQCPGNSHKLRTT